MPSFNPTPHYQWFYESVAECPDLWSGMNATEKDLNGAKRPSQEAPTFGRRDSLFGSLSERREILRVYIVHGVQDVSADFAIFSIEPMQNFTDFLTLTSIL